MNIASIYNPFACTHFKPENNNKTTEKEQLKMPEINMNIAQEALNAWTEMNKKGLHQFIVLKLTPQEITLDATFARCQDQADSFEQLQKVLQSIPANE